MEILEKELMSARARWEESVSHSLKTIADTSHASDEAILELVSSLIKEVTKLQRRVDTLEVMALVGE